MLSLVDLKQVKRNSAQYHRLAQETYRADHQILKQLPDWTLAKIKQWESTIRIRPTRHWLEERLAKYVNVVSRDGRYLEMLPCEWQWLLGVNLESWLSSAHRVELGWNVHHQVCKLAYVLPLHEYCPEIYPPPVPTRYFFFCVGVDGGLKTAYFTPEFKDRPSYGGQVPYVDLEYLLRPPR